MPAVDHTGPLMLQVRTLRDANRRQRRIIESLRRQHDQLNDALQDTLVTLLSRGPLSKALETALAALETSSDGADPDDW